MAGLIMFLSLCILASEVRAVEVRKNLQISPPKIQDGTITHFLSIPFDTCPADYWVYYNASSGKMVIDFYGVQLKSEELDSLKNPIVGDIEIKNMETLMSLSGKRSQILFSLEKGWHYDASVVPDNTLQLKLWRKLKQPEILRKKQFNIAALLTITLIGAGIISFGLMAFTDQTTNH
jgi:hypothetical protein